MIKILLLVILLFTGCASHSVNTQTKEHQLVKTKQRLLGDQINCSKKRIDLGYSKEMCGETWGVPLQINWGGNE